MRILIVGGEESGLQPRSWGLEPLHPLIEVIKQIKELDWHATQRSGICSHVSDMVRCLKKPCGNAV